MLLAGQRDRAPAIAWADVGHGACGKNLLTAKAAHHTHGVVRRLRGRLHIVMQDMAMRQRNIGADVLAPKHAADREVCHWRRDVVEERQCCGAFVCKPEVHIAQAVPYQLSNAGAPVRPRD